ncbi:hypothetical protein [Salinisphaera orenii]|uniref:hypothetical protein n=1 Tax=Salinisphaera orenii TaxID=856731 RepID=UPI003A4C6B0E
MRADTMAGNAAALWHDATKPSQASGIQAGIVGVPTLDIAMSRAVFAPHEMFDRFAGRFLDVDECDHMARVDPVFAADKGLTVSHRFLFFLYRPVKAGLRRSATG